MTALGDLLAVLACLDMRASLAGLADLRRLVLTYRRTVQTPPVNQAAHLSDQGLDPADAPQKIKAHQHGRP
jgi:hypothetical protein